MYDFSENGTCYSNTIFSNNGRYLYFGQEKSIIKFDTNKGKIVKELDCGENGSVWSLAVSDSGDHIYVGTCKYDDNEFVDDLSDLDSDGMLIEEESNYS